MGRELGQQHMTEQVDTGRERPLSHSSLRVNSSGFSPESRTSYPEHSWHTPAFAGVTEATLPFWAEGTVRRASPSQWVSQRVRDLGLPAPAAYSASTLGSAQLHDWASWHFSHSATTTTRDQP